MLVYRTFTILSLTSAIWVGWNVWSNLNTPSLCLFRNITGLPCPSCGITHSVLAILQFHFMDALQANILGFVAVMLMLLVPPLIITDYLFNRNYFFTLYSKSEKFIRENKIVAVTLIIIVVGNWMILIAGN